MDASTHAIVFHFDDNKPLAYNRYNIQFHYHESPLRIKKKLDFIIQTYLMNDVAFAFDLSSYQEEQHALRVSKQYAIAATYFVRKQQQFPLTPREEQQKEFFILHAMPIHLQELLD